VLIGRSGKKKKNILYIYLPNTIGVVLQWTKYRKSDMLHLQDSSE